MEKRKSIENKSWSTISPNFRKLRIRENKPFVTFCPILLKNFEKNFEKTVNIKTFSAREFFEKILIKHSSFSRL